MSKNFKYFEEDYEDTPRYRNKGKANPAKEQARRDARNRRKEQRFESAVEGAILRNTSVEEEIARRKANRAPKKENFTTY